MMGFFGGNRPRFGHLLLEFLLHETKSAPRVFEYLRIGEEKVKPNHMDWSSVPLPWAIVLRSLSVVAVS